MIRIALIVFSLAFFPSWLIAQTNIPIGDWRTHFSYQNGRLLTISNEQAYVATQNGLFTYHFAENELSILTKMDGLSDTGISALHYQPSDDFLVLAYRSGIIDLLLEGNILTFDLLADGNEQINAISTTGNQIYLATSEGVRVLNVAFDEREVNIQESYTRLGISGEILAILDITIREDSIFLASESGVLANSLSSSVNRQDFRSWRRDWQEAGLPPLPVTQIAVQGQTVVATLKGRGVFTYDGKDWSPTAIQTEEDFTSLVTSEQAVLATSGSQAWVLGEELETFTLPIPQGIAQTADGTLWVADGKLGLVKIREGQQESFYPNGPISDDLYSIHAMDEIMIGLQTDQAAFSTFQSGRWLNFDTASLSGLVEQESLSPLIDTDFFAADEHYYFASPGSGLLRWDGSDAFELITAGEGNQWENNDISALATEGARLWITNYDADRPLHLYSASDESWSSFTLNATDARFPLTLEILENRPWMICGQGGVRAQTGTNLAAYDPDINETRSVRSLVASGNLPGSTISDFAKDQNGQGWLTGNDGISYLPIPAEIFTSSQPVVIKPIFENQFLLFGEPISALAVDGGNRKWVGTGEGIWLFEESGEALVSRFTIDNSPLPSDNILDIAVGGTSGEVFILTDRGLVSYRGTATQGQIFHQNVKIFPNPVPLSFGGLVGMEGLANNATVKVTTVSGLLVRQLQAEGGTAVWNMLDYNGSRVSTGIYLVFSASEDGSETFVGKIAVIN